MATPDPTVSDRRKQSAPEPLNLFSLRDLEYRLGFSREFLRTIAKNSSAHYNPFDLPKEPRPFTKSKPKIKLRRIDRPTGALREVQDRIYYGLLRDLKVPSYLCGGVKGRSVMMN